MNKGKIGLDCSMVANALARKSDAVILEELMFITNKHNIGDVLWCMKDGVLIQFKVRLIELFEQSDFKRIIYNKEFNQEFCYKSKNKCLDAYILFIRKQKDEK